MLKKCEPAVKRPNIQNLFKQVSSVEIGIIIDEVNEKERKPPIGRL